MAHRSLPSTILFFFLVILILAISACATAPDDAVPDDNGRVDDTERMDGPPTPLENIQRFLEESTPELARPVLLGLESPDYQDGDGNTTLIVAALHEATGLAAQALEQGADPNLARNDGFTALHISAYFGNSELVELLLEHDANVNAVSDAELTPLHLAVEDEHANTTELLLYHDADAFAQRGDGLRPFDAKNDLAADYRELIQETNESYGAVAVVPVLRFGEEIGPYAEQFGPTVEQAYAERGMDAFQTGTPEGGPFPESEISIPRTFDYVEEPYFEITARNSGRGDLFGLTAEVTVDGGDTVPVFFGWLPPEAEATRVVTLPEPGLGGIGADLGVEVEFSEANDWTAPSQRGSVSIASMNNRRVQEYIELFDTTDVRELVAGEHIDRRAVDRLIHFEEIEYAIDDLIFFASERAVSQDIVESVIVDELVSYSNEDLIALAEHNYLTRSIVESLFRGGRDFSRAEIQALADLGVFNPPEVLYTYTVRDGGTPTSTGNQDGIIQPGESPDFTFRLRNDSVFELEDVSARIETDHPDLELFKPSHRIDQVSGGETVEVTTQTGLRPRFEGERFELELVVENEQFGELLRDVVEVPVDEDVETDPILALNKDVVSTEAVEVYDGASDDTPVVNTFQEGARFEVTGELGGYYRVSVAGRDGWLLQKSVADYSPEGDPDYELASDIADDEGFFANQRPEVVINSPRNNDVIDHNQVTLDVTAIDRQHGIESVAVWVNDELLPGSHGERGLAVVGREEHDQARVERGFDLSLRTGENTIRVVAYNGNNIESHDEEITIESTGMRNPPRLFVLSVGVDDYNNPDWDLRFAAKDAETIGEIFEAQRGVGLYDEVHTQVLLNEEATRENIIAELETFVGRARRHDTVVVFMAGHGIQHRDTYYFMGADADLDTPTRRGLDQDVIQRALRYNVDSERALVMLDTCQSGFIPGRRDAGPDMTRVVERLAETQGIAYLSASRGNEAARENPNWGHGAFTLAVREALLEGMARPAEGSQALRIDELYSYVSDRVIELTDGQQRPLLSGSMEFFPLYGVAQ